ncbi:Myb-like DNA-binding protein [Nitzschia inconspicua]|uniref:Myb-like DNA-binding protein n=1 Tax=Nitzschia inconspicua TaxID=303405 RepID=A0A9K3LJT9_9STRA|nr:Myb-like DNA-binding protein [Nitzschia inconspicua]
MNANFSHNTLARRDDDDDLFSRLLDSEAILEDDFFEIMEDDKLAFSLPSNGSLDAIATFESGNGSNHTSDHNCDWDAEVNLGLAESNVVTPSPGTVPNGGGVSNLEGVEGFANVAASSNLGQNDMDRCGYRSSNAHHENNGFDELESQSVVNGSDSGSDEEYSRFGDIQPDCGIFRDNGFSKGIGKDLIQDYIPAPMLKKKPSVSPIKSMESSLYPPIPLVVTDYPQPEEVVSTGNESSLAGVPTQVFKLEGNQASQLTRHKHWTDEEDEQLRVAVKQESVYGEKNDWKHIAKKYFGNSRSGTQCKVRWKNHLKPGIKRGKWLQHEDETILFMVEQGKKWAEIAHRLPGRIGENVRERYVNVLDPLLKKTPWTEKEDEILFEAQARLGNRWSAIRKFIPGRSENSIKNRFHNRKNAHLRKRKRDAEEQEMREAGIVAPWDTAVV